MRISDRAKLAIGFVVIAAIGLSFGKVIDHSKMGPAATNRGEVKKNQRDDQNASHDDRFAKRSAQRNEQGAAGGNGDDGEHMKITDWLLVGVGILQAGLIGGQIIVYLRQARIMGGQLKITGRAAITAKKSADLALAIELPVFVIEHIVVSKTTGQYVIQFGNHGRTPAIILANCLVLELTTALPPEPLYAPDKIDEVGQDRAVGSGKFYEIVRKPSVEQADWDRVATAETALWCYGFIDYLDFTKQEHREGFCIGFEPARLKAASRRYPLSPPGEVQWMRGGPPAYTYNKTRQKDGSYT